MYNSQDEISYFNDVAQTIDAFVSTQRSDNKKIDNLVQGKVKSALVRFRDISADDSAAYSSSVKADLANALNNVIISYGKYMYYNGVAKGKESNFVGYGDPRG